jgi:putative SOS response-associated peptidase YedK
MCNRYKSKLQACQIRDLMTADLTVMQEAESLQPKADVRISTEALLVFEYGGRWVMGTGFWGIKIGAKQRFNARSETIATTWPWKDWQRCWLPATSWIEYPEIEGKSIATEVQLPGGEPFLLAGVCGMVGEVRRFSMQTQDSPANLLELGTRMPMPYQLDAVGQAAPQQINERMVFDAEWRSPQ